MADAKKAAEPKKPTKAEKAAAAKEAHQNALRILSRGDW